MTDITNRPRVCVTGVAEDVASYLRGYCDRFQGLTGTGIVYQAEALWTVDHILAVRKSGLPGYCADQEDVVKRIVCDLRIWLESFPEFIDIFPASPPQTMTVDRVASGHILTLTTQTINTHVRVSEQQYSRLPRNTRAVYEDRLDLRRAVNFITGLQELAALHPADTGTAIKLYRCIADYIILDEDPSCWLMEQLEAAQQK